MQFLNFYFEYIVKYDLINKFNYNTINQIPKFTSIILNFNYKNVKQSFSILLISNILLYKNSKIIKANTTNLSLKIQKGDPILLQIVLTNKNLINLFLLKLLLQLNFNYKQLNISKPKKFVSSKKSFLFTIKKSLVFPEIEKNFKFFNNLVDSQIIILTNTKTSNELIFLLKTYKFPL